MKFLYKISLLVFGGLSLVSCSNYLDVNDNPNVATVADPRFLFVSEEVGLSNNRTMEIWVPVGLSAQVFASGGQNGWGIGEDQYDISIFSTGNTWRELYTNVIKNSNLAIEAAKVADPVNKNAIAQHEILQAYAFWELTSLWGDVPFTEAVKVDISEPKFDSQDVVLQGILDLLDEAIGYIDLASSLKIVDQDLYFSGDMVKWSRFANALKLRVLFMMVDSDASKSTEIAALINADKGLKSNADNVLFPYYNQAGNYNPQYNIFYTYNGGVNNWFFAINHTLNLMKDGSDPRIPVYFNPGPDSDPDVFTSVSTTQNADETKDAVIGSFFLQPDSPDPLMTYSEYLLLEAEAHARGFVGSMADADTKLRAAITANMQFMKVSASDIAGYLSGVPDLESVTATEAKTIIAQQQWVDLFNRPLEAWTQWRRTEIPAMTLPPGALAGGLIRRWPYPPREVSANSKTPEQQSLDVKMWFDK